MNALSSVSFERYLALDILKRYVDVGGVNSQQQVILPQRRLNHGEWDLWIQKHLHLRDAVVLEAATNAWHFYDQVAPHAGRTVVAHPCLVKVIAAARVKTDERDAQTAAANLIHEVWVPPQEVRELRALLAHRRRLIKMGTMTRNRLNSVIHRYNVNLPRVELFLLKHRAWWLGLKLSLTEQLRIRQDFATLDHLGPAIAEMNAELFRLSTLSPWPEHVPYLMQLQGFAIIVAMTVLAAIGDIMRFPTAKRLVGYSGLGASVHDSGETHHTGHIAKQGRKGLRWILVEAARIAVIYDAYWQMQYARLEERMGSSNAIVVVAWKFLVVVWHVLHERTSDCHANAVRVAAKLMTWSWALNDQQRGGMATRQFTRYQLMRLKIGDGLTQVHTAGRARPLVSVDEVLALRPELKSEA